MAPTSKRVDARTIIETPTDIARGCMALRRLCPTIRMLHDTVGDPPLRRRKAGFAGLARIVVGQQLSIASAESIWRRLSASVEPFEPASLLACTEEALRTAGLSRAKIKTLRAVASAAVNGDVCFDALPSVSEAELRARLTAIPGIGPWSADIYLMFCIGSRDGFAPGDLALQEAVRLASGAPARPSPAELEAIAERWRPWRGVAARLLWSYYAHLKRTTAAAKPAGKPARAATGP